jgi:hypothetical protein
LERVMVGRVEVLTPETERRLLKAVGDLGARHLGTQLAARAALAKLGRLQEPVLHRIAALAPTAEVKARADALLKNVAGH